MVPPLTTKFSSEIRLRDKYPVQKYASKLWVYSAEEVKSLKRFNLADPRAKFGLKNFIKITSIFFIFTVNFQMCSGNCFAGQAKHIRVAIIQDAQSIDLYIKGFYKIIDPIGDKVVSRGKYLICTVSTYKDGISIGSLKCPAEKLLIAVDDPEAIKINGRKYRGNIQFIKKDNSALLAVNFIELEDYIKGILFHEVSHYWPHEALMAQAVACRTYAVYQKNQNASKDYDVTSDIYSQVYGGKTSERHRTNKAVEDTAGEVLTYHNKIFPAYFHSTCAGHTEDAYLLWGVDIAPLKGVACGYCIESSHYKWLQALSLSSIKQSMIKAGYKECGDIINIVIENKDVSGRGNDLIVKNGNQDIKIDSKDLRAILGANILKSTNFIVTIADKNAIFEGLGWGHGVGMCQWGAYSMAKEGFDYKQILEYYYPGSQIINYYK